MAESPKQTGSPRPAKIPVGKPAPAGGGTAGTPAHSGAAVATAEPAEIRRKLAWRMGFAGFLILLLLAALALFDQLSSSEEEPETPTFTEPVPVGRKEITQPVTPAEAPLVPGALPEREAEAARSPARPAPPEASAAPAGPPPRPEVHAQPVEPRTESRPAPIRQPAMAPAAPVSPAARPGEASSGRPPAEALARPSPAQVPVRVEAPARVEEAPAPRLPPAPARLFSGYALQAGVFADPRRAEELHARLTLNGIPSTLEARVQVGPFTTREEADAAREKMKSLGIDAVLLMPKGGKR